MKYLKNIFISILLIFLFSTCQNKNVIRIAILHTNDIHGRIDNFDKLKYLKDSLQSIYDTVLLINAGDIFSGNPYVDNYIEKGFPIVDLMNKVGYNLSTLGNHEFDFGQNILEDRIIQANFSFIVGNIETDTGFFATLKPSYSFNIKETKIKFFSLIETNNNGKPSTHPSRVKGLNFSNPLEKAKQLLSKDQECDALIGLTHVGFFTDSILAISYPQLDAIIGGHSHTLIENKKLINNVLIAQAGENLEHVGLIELNFKNKQLVSKTYKIIDFDALPKQNNQLTNLIESYQKNDFLDEELAIAKTSMKNRNELGCFFTDAQLSVHNLDLVFQNYWGIRVNHLPEGPITRKEILELDPFQNELMIYNMTINEIKSLIKYSYYLSKQHIDLFISGGFYTIETDVNDSLVSIQLLDRNQNPLNQNKLYKVGINNYVTQSYQLVCADSGRSSNTTTTENIINYLLKVKEIDYTGCERVKIIKK